MCIIIIATSRDCKLISMLQASQIIDVTLELIEVKAAWQGRFI